MVNMCFLETIDFFLIYDIFSKICFGLFILDYYYLVDTGYTNEEGFLAPYRGQRYHLNDQRKGHMPTTHEEFFKSIYLFYIFAHIYLNYLHDLYDLHCYSASISLIIIYEDKFVNVMT